jgi:hypothetical protein
VFQANLKRRESGRRTIVKRLTINVVMVALGLGLSLSEQTSQAGEPKGYTTSDAASLKGAFVIHNPSNHPKQGYQVKWGDKGEWKTFTLRPGESYTHSYPLDKKGMAPIPYVRWDSVVDDGKKVTKTEQEVDFGRVGYTGYNSKGNVNKAWHYDFQYRKDGRHLDLVAR